MFFPQYFRSCFLIYVFDFVQFFVVHFAFLNDILSAMKRPVDIILVALACVKNQWFISIICQQYCMRFIINRNILINCLCMVAKYYGWLTPYVSFNIVTVLFFIMLFWWLTMMSKTGDSNHGDSNYRQLDCLYNSFFSRLAPDKALKPRITGPLWGESNGNWWIPHIKGHHCVRRSMSWHIHEFREMTG